MNNLQIFKNEEFGEIRTVTINDDVWFVGKDVCEAFGDTNYRRSLSNIDELDKYTAPIYTKGGRQNMTLINESGLYSLLFQMQPQKAKGVSQNEPLIEERIIKLKKFKRWVTSEVLPSIRKNGAYLTDQKAIDLITNPQSLIGLLEQAAEQLKQKDIRIEEMRPKEIFADAVSSSTSSILVRDLAKILKQNGIDIGEKRLYKWFRNRGFIIQNSTRPTQKAMELGLFEIIESTVQRGDRSPLVTMTTKVTGKGQQYFINKFLGGEA